MMRTFAIVVLALLITGFQSRKHTDYSGSWQLDLKESTDLPPSFKAVDSYVMTVEQTKDSMKCLVKMTGNGQDVKFPLTSYNLNGNESFREDTARKSKRWSKVSWTGGGKRFSVKSRVEQGRDAVTYTQVDDWELKNRDTLRISVKQTFTAGKDPHSELRIFHRVK